MASTVRRVWLVAAGTGLACVLLIAWLTWWNGSDGSGHDTPEQAVKATCHAAKIMANYTPSRSTNIRIGWQEKGDAPGVGWSALVVSEDGGYRVKNCKFQHVTHA